MQVITTISRGRLVWHNDKLDVQPGTGRFVKTPPGGHLFAGLSRDTKQAPAWMQDMHVKNAHVHKMKSAKANVPGDADQVLREEL